MASRTLARASAVFAGLVLTAVACTDDNPETPLPCAFWEQQFDTGAVELDEVPEDCRAGLDTPTTSAPTTEPTVTTGTPGDADEPSGFPDDS